ncbi:DUF418 domain-containing protein [Spirillospora sp. CA-294931]|uniref:DUF418 domain-containing protein n=1 Tax=Spirillospora sp. CA-294931 TaxID=3240042 RepID=UPI003D8C9F1A
MKPDGRIRELDAVRGFALCGITFVNVVGITGVHRRHMAYEVLLHQRFFPVFAFLFGLGCALFLRAHESRTALVARLGFLIPIGAAHQVLQPDEVLLPYAVAGLVLIVPASFLPHVAALWGGAVFACAAVFVGEGGNLLIPGAVLLGFASAYYPVPDWRWIGAASGAGAVVLGVWQIFSPEPAAIAGVITGVAYASGLVLLLGTRARAALLFFLEPLGRLALTNYLSATVLVVLADRYLRLGRLDSAAGLAVAVLLVQVAFGRWWLRRFRLGPAEWVWRCLTWWRVVPLRSSYDRVDGRTGEHAP